MKLTKMILTAMIATGIVTACSDGIDPIKRVDPGADESAPVVNVNYPIEGTQVRVVPDVTPISIEIEAMDDIELASVVVELDGTEIAEFTDFKDYRRALETYTYNELTNGDHVLEVTATDLAGKSTTKLVNFKKVPPYNPLYSGEMFYMPFDGDYTEQVTITNATKVGSPTFSNDVIAGSKSYQGAAGGYLTFPTSKLTLGAEFSAAFWYNVNSSPDRSGIMVIGPPDPALPATPNNRTKGFRLFREGGATNQTIKLNVGTGTADSWFDGGAAATVNPSTTGWIHIAFTINALGAKVYINGTQVSSGTFPVDMPEIDWTGCDVLSIASGAPRFMEWGHLSDGSLYDEIRLFNKALTQAEIQAIIDAED